MKVVNTGRWRPLPPSGQVSFGRNFDGRTDSSGPPNNALAAVSKKDSVAERLVTEAPRAEVNGDETSRKALLDQAVQAVPDYRLAHWQQGQLELANQWMNVEEAQRRTAADPRHAEYAQLRASSTDSLADQLTLAYWCRKHQLPDEANVHWANVLGFEPTNEEALWRGQAVVRRPPNDVCGSRRSEGAAEECPRCRQAVYAAGGQMGAGSFERRSGVAQSSGRNPRDTGGLCHSGFGGFNTQRTAERRSRDHALGADRLGVCKGSMPCRDQRRNRLSVMQCFRRVPRYERRRRQP